MYVMRGRYLFGVVFGAALLASALLVVTMAPTAQSQGTEGVPSATCFGSPVTDGNFGATSGPDVLTGNPQVITDTADPDDVINGLGGDDTIRGEIDFSGTPPGGEDKLCGGPGDDPFIDGGDKSDKIDGGQGDDVLDGDNFPSPFSDVLKGRDGDDTFTGGQGNDKIKGGAGNDMIDVGTSTVSEGADTINAGPGDDTINAMEEPAKKDKVNCGSGEDTVISDGSDKIADNCENVEESMP